MTWPTKVPLSQLTLEQRTGDAFPAGTQVNVYLRNTSTPVTLYTDAGGGTTRANPTTIDSAGNAVGYVDPQDLTVVINSVSANVTLPPSQADLSPSSALTAYAPLASPAFTGTPTAPTPTAGDNDTSIATTAFVAAAVTVAGGGTVLADNGDGTGTLTVSGAAAGELVHVVAVSGAAQTIPALSAATDNRVTLTANCTFTFPTPGTGQSFSLTLVQDGTGSRTVTFPASVKWPGAVTPTLTATAAKRDVFSFKSDGSDWLGFVAGENY